MNTSNSRTVVISPHYLKLNLKSFRVCYDESSQILVYIHREQPILFFQTLLDLSILPLKLSTPITFIPKGPILSVVFSYDRRFISLLRTENSIEIYNLIDPKHTCVKVNIKSKDCIIPNGIAWLHSKKETKDQTFFSPILAVATKKYLSFYEVTLKSAGLIKSIKMAVSELWSNRLNQLVIAAEGETGRVSVYTVKEMGVVKYQTFSLPEVPTRKNTFVSTIYRATYLYQHSASRGLLFIFGFSNRDNEFRYYNTIALPYQKPAVISLSDNLLIFHFKDIKESYCIDLADVPYDAVGNVSSPIASRNAITRMDIITPSQLGEDMKDALNDPSFAYEPEQTETYYSNEVQIASPSIGLELESTFQKLLVSSLDGRVHGCLDNSAYVKGYTATISPMVKSQVQLGSYITHINDQFIVGNTFSSVLQLLRQEKRPVKIRFERGINPNDPYIYRGDQPIASISELDASTDYNELLYSNNISYLLNNVMVDKSGALFTMRLLLTIQSASAISNIQFLLRRRSQIPISMNGSWFIEENKISKYPRLMLQKLLIQQIPSLLEDNQLHALFELLNTDYAALVRRAVNKKDLDVYLQSTEKVGTTRELNGNIVLTQTEMMKTVFSVLHDQMSLHNYVLMIIQYIQSLMAVQIPVSSQLSNHLRSILLDEGGDEAASTIVYLHQSGLLPQDVAASQRQLVDKSTSPLCTELSLQVLRKANDFSSLLNYYLRQENLDEMLRIMAKNAPYMRDDLNLWMLNAIKLAIMLYDENDNLDDLYSMYHFIQHYKPAVMKNIRYPNRLGGLIEFADDSTEDVVGTNIPTKGEALKDILQQAKQNIVRLTFG